MIPTVISMEAGIRSERAADLDSRVLLQGARVYVGDGLMGWWTG